MNTSFEQKQRIGIARVSLKQEYRPLEKKNHQGDEGERRTDFDGALKICSIQFKI